MVNKGGPMDIGKKIKALRTQIGLTQEELASRCELSKGFLSQLENDLTSPSIATLSDIVEALGTNLSLFFKEEKQEQVVFSDEDFFVDEQEGFSIHWVVPNAQKNEMEPILLELDAKGESQVITPHEGEEFAYVIAGKIDLNIEEVTHTLSKGDTFYIKGTKEHQLLNPYTQKAKVLWVCTPPIF